MQTHYEAMEVGWLILLVVLPASLARRGDPEEGTDPPFGSRPSFAG